MVSDQLSMFEVGPDQRVLAARCRLCPRPARWLTTRQEWAAYCSGSHCSNRERICQNCGKPFHMNVGLAGTKYCATCKTNGRPDRPFTHRPMPCCAWCGQPSSVLPRPNFWPYICRLCLDPVKHLVDRLKSHHVQHERARQLITDPGCEICGTDIVAKVKVRSHGHPKALLVVDHDHNCCPVTSPSCGECVRGLICSYCNTAAGLLADEPKRARALGDYLEAWANR